MIRLSVFSSVIILFGCAAPPARPPVHFPITSGFHKELPRRDTRILVWGTPPVVGTATTWLQSHGLLVISADRARQTLPDQQKLTGTYTDAPFVLRLGKSLDADVVLFGESETSAEATSRRIGNFQPVYELDVTIRGVNVRTNEVEWKGNAHYPPLSQLPANAIGQLTCQALATAWGFRPAGQLEIPSEMMCTVGQTEPAVTP